MDFQLIDWVVIFAYVALVFIVALKAGIETRSQKHLRSEDIAQEQYLASKSLTFWESFSSIIATEVSALTFLGIPAFAFNKNFSFIQIYMGAILGRLIIAKVFLPKVYNQGLTIYEIMTKGTGLPSGRRGVALIFMLSKILSVGVRLFSGAILVSHFLNINVYLGLAGVTFITFLYTLIGGLKAVVRTDILQMLLFILGGFVAHVIIPRVSGQNWIDMMSFAHSAGKTSFIDFSNLTPFILGIMGGVLFDMSTHGVDQDYAQRLMANKNLKDAQRAIFFSSFFSIFVGLIFLGVGALLYAHYAIGGLPAGVENADHLFSYFIVHHFPVGIRGLMVAGVLAATMSTLDSTINALCATLYNDILPARDLSKIKFFSFVDTLFITLGLFSIAVMASKNDGLLMLGLKVQSWTGGSLLGIFLAKVILKKWFHFKLTMASVIGAYSLGTMGVYFNTELLNWDWNLNVYWGCALSLLFLKLYSFIYPLETKEI